VTVDLGDFTVLIGPNDSGKTSFLEALRDVGKSTREEIGSVFSEERSLANLVWRKDPTRNVVWEVAGRTGGEPFVYHVELPIDSRPRIESLEYQGKKLFWIDGMEIHGWQRGQLAVQGERTAFFHFFHQREEPHTTIAQEFAPTVEYHFDPEKLYGPSVPLPDAQLQPSGENLASVLDGLRNSLDRTAFDALESTLHEAIPTLRGIRLPPQRQGQGAKTVEFILSANGQPPVAIPGKLASSGALLLTAYLALAYGNTPGVLLIEEPENGLHPFRLKLLIEILRKISTGEVGNRRRQVVVTTHSPLLLNYVKPEEVRVFVQHQERGTQVTPLTQVPDSDRLLKEFSIGELWYLLGEEKLLEGQPA
jgi:predicted ATPase